MRAITTVLAAFALTIGVLSGPALAGGWAVTTFDQLPGQFVANYSYTIGWTIRQHGETPVNVDKTEILAIASGKTHVFTGKSQGPTGHYVATVLFPAAGVYTWQVTQNPFAPQDLGTLTVAATMTSGSDDKKAAKGADTKGALADDKGAAAKGAVADAKGAVDSKGAVADAKGAVAGTSTQNPAAPASDPLRTALPIAAAGATAMFLWRLVTMLRGARSARAG